METGRVAVGHPVDVASGTVFTAKNDFHLPGTLDIRWRRRYDSDSTLNSWLGRGWGAPYFMTLEREDGGYRLNAADGHGVLFPAAGILPEGKVLRNLYSSMELRREGDSFTVLHWHAGSSAIIRWRFPASDWSPMPLAAVENLAGHRVLLEYDGVGRVARLFQELEARTVQITYDTRNLITALSFLAESGPQPLVHYDYDGDRRLVRATDALGNATTYAYDAAHRMVAERNALGSAFHFQYDDQGRCVVASGDGGYTARRLRYFPGRQLTRVEDSLGNVSEYLLNAAGQVVQELSPRGIPKTYKYDEFGRRTDVLYADGATEHFEYDERGDRTKVVHEDGNASSMKFDDLHQLIEFIDPTGARYVFQRDARGNVLSLTNPLGAVFSCTRDARGLVQEVRTPGGLIERRRYGPANRWREAEDQIGLIARVDCDERGNEVARYDSAGRVHRTAYDALNRPVAREDAGGRRWMYRWNALHEVVEQIGPGGERDVWEYDAFGQVTAHSDALGTTRLAYDSEGRLVGVTNRVGETMSWRYDADGYREAEQFFDGRWQRYEHGPRGNCTKIHRSDGRVVEQQFDKSSCLVKRESSDGLKETYKYDKAARLTFGANNHSTLELERDPLGRVIAEIQNGHRVEFEYDLENNRTARRLGPEQPEELRITRDVRGRVVALGDAAGVWQELAWDGSNRLVERRFEAGVRELRAYGPSRALAQKRVLANGGTEVVRRDYEYDGRGYLAVSRETGRPVTRYAYDALGRLIGTDRGERYTYDAGGSILESHRGRRQLAPGGRVLADGQRRLTYDAAGCVARIEAPATALDLEYSVHEQLREVVASDGSRVTYAYDVLGRRIARQSAEGKTEFIWDGCYPAAELRDGSPGDRFYFLGWEPLAQWKGGQRLMPVVDRAGAVRELVDGRGAVLWQCTLDAYGNLLAQSGAPASPFRLPGQRYDAETGFHDNFARTYDPLLCGYLAPDPIGIAGGTNLYAYPRNPILWDDPFGLECSPAHTAEQEMDEHFTGPPPEGKGYVKISDDEKSVYANGIDAVYKNPNGGPPEYVIAEAKSGSADLGYSKNGTLQQMSDQWINGKPGGRGDDRLTSAVGADNAAAIRDSATAPGQGATPNVQKVVYSKPDPDQPGSVVQSGAYTDSRRRSF